MCENNGVLLSAYKRYTNGVYILHAVFGFVGDSGIRSLIPVELYLYTVGDTEVEDTVLYNEAYQYAHIIKHHCPFTE